MKSKFSLPILIIAAFFFFILGLGEVSAYAIDAQTEGTILYVKPGANGDCLSWDTACELQTAIFNAVSGDQIWVAAGTYKPTTSSNREATFQLKNGVAIYGGYPVAGGDWSQRDWETNTTTLSGDIGIVGNSDDNSYHVVTGSGVDSTSILDGFTITAGNSDATSYPHNSGGGMYNSSGSPTLANIIFSTNSALGDGYYQGGGGMANFGSNPNLTNVTFTNNTAVSGSGGGMYNNLSSPTLTNVIFTENMSVDGGGMFNIYSSSPILSNVTFSSNTSGSGGGISNYSNCNPLLNSVTFTANEAGYGGGVNNYGSSPTMINVTLSANKAHFGGGMRNIYSSSPSLTNVTFFGNIAVYGGGGIYSEYNFPGIPEVTNTIFWGNSPAQIGGDVATVTYSDIQGGFTGEGNIDADPLLGNLADNGGFTLTHALSAGSPAIDAGNPNNCPGTDQRGYLRPIDGDSNGTAVCDMGAYEYANVLYVKPGVNGTCTSWADACELQTAIFNTVSGDQIWVAAGTYKPTTSSNREATFQLKNGVAIYGGFPDNGGAWEERDWETYPTTLSGDIGLPGINTDNSYHVVIGSGIDESAILDGFTVSGGNSNDNGGGIYFVDGSPTLSNLIISGNSAAESGGGIYNSNSNPVLTNLTITGNSAYRGGGVYSILSNPTMSFVDVYQNSAADGGGIYNNVSCPVMTNLMIVENTASTNAGGMINYDRSHSYMKDVTFYGNSAVMGGGGLYNSRSNPSLINVTFVENQAIFDGGGMYNYISSPTLTNILFERNNVVGQYNGAGGGIFNYDQSNPILTNVTFSGNTVGSEGGVGGGMSNVASYPVLTNVTFYENHATLRGGGIETSEGDFTATNAIFWGNTPDQISGSPTSVTFSVVQGGYPGANNTELDPLLAPLADNGGYNHTHALLDNSPAIDSGNPSACLTIDQRIYSRHIDGNGDGIAVCDIGAYEFNSSLALFALPVNMVGEGVVIKNPDKYEYEWREVVTLTAYANTGWTFTGWGGDASGTDNHISVTMGEVQTPNIIVFFTQNEYLLSTSSNPSNAGVVTKSPSKPYYHYGEEVTLTAIPIPGWSFAGWSGDATGLTNPLTVTITGNTNITAHFTQDEYTMAVLVNPEGKGSVSITPLQSTYHYGDVVTLTASSIPGWTFSSWSGDATGTNNPLSYIVLGDTSITANFTQNEYTLGVSVSPLEKGTVEVTPLQSTYHYGDVVTLTATAIPGWSFSGWSGTTTSNDNPFTYTIQGDTSITANFTQDEYSLSIAVNTSGSGTVTVSPVKTTYHYGDTVTLTADANPGWTFSSWSGDATGTVNPLTLTIYGNTSITANFTQDEYTLQVGWNPIDKGSISVSPIKDTYHYGDVVTLTASAIPGWSFGGWGGDASGMVNHLEYTIMGNTSITAVFTQDEYSLTLNLTHPNSGTVTIEPLQTTYHYGDVVTLTATSNPGWNFDGWSGDAISLDNPLSFTIYGNSSINADFTQIEYSLLVDISPLGKGAVTVSPSQTTYHYGDVVTLTATGIPGWSFSSWSGDASDNENPLTFTIVGNTNITANFTQDEYSLIVTLNGSGSVDINPNQATYHYGDLVTLNATANAGWTFSSWSGDETGTDNPLTVTIDGNTSISANFTQNEYILTVGVNPTDSGTVTIEPVQAIYHYGDVVTLTAIPNENWLFDSWSGDVNVTENPLIVTIEGNVNITANFIVDEWSLNLSVNPEGMGSVTVDPLKESYQFGDEVTLTATAIPGWSFAGWSGDAEGMDNPLYLTIYGDTSIVANFTQDEYVLTIAIEPADSGSVSVTPEKETYHYGDEVTLTAVPGAAWSFSSWSGDLNSLENPFTFTITGNTSLSANFNRVFRLFMPLITRN